MTQETSLPPIRTGYAYSIEFNFASGFLGAGETVRAELRTSPGYALAATFDSDRNADTVTLSLTEEQTADLVLRTHYTDLVIVTVDDVELPITDQIFAIPVEQGITEHSQ